MVNRPPVIDVFLTMYKYPEMLELVVESINRARKPREYRFWGVFEHGFEPVLEEIFDRIEGEKHKIKRDKRYGINWNTPATWMGMGRRTEGEYVVQLQSDIVASTDFFEFIDYVMTNTDVGYVLAYAPFHSRERDDAAYAVKCGQGWYGHWGSAVRSDVLRDIYPKYLTDGYRKDYDHHAKKHFPGIKAGGSDFFINAFLFKEGVSGARPTSSRTTNIGIDGEHIRLIGGDKKRYNQMSREQKLNVLRDIIENGIYHLKINVNLKRAPRILGEYEWTSLHKVDIERVQRHTGTDL